MFEAAVVKFVEGVSKNGLEPVPDLFSAEKCQPWQIVVKRGRKYIWNKIKFIPTQFGLSDILTPQSVLTPSDPVTKSSAFITSYLHTHKLSLDGKLGAKLKEVLTIDLSGREFVNLRVNLGEITKLELNEVELNKKLESGLFVDLKNNFIKQVSSDSRNCLCLVTACLVLAKTCFITGATEIEVHEHISGKVSVPVVKIDAVNLDQEGNYNSKCDKYIRIPAGTPLAFDLMPLAVSQDGRLSLVFDESKPCGFHISNKDVVDGLLDCTLDWNDDVPEPPAGLLNHLSSCVLLLCKDPLGIHGLSHTLNQAYDYLHICSSQADLAHVQHTIKKHEEHFVGEAKMAWTSILTSAGFIVEDNNVTAPTVSSEQLEALAQVFDQLDFLGYRAVLAFSHLTDDCILPTSVVLESIVSSHIDGIEVQLSESVSSLPKAGQDLIEALGLLQPGMLQKWERASATLQVLRALWCLQSA